MCSNHANEGVRDPDVVETGEFVKYKKQGEAKRQERHQEVMYPNVTSLYIATPLAFNAPDKGFLVGRSP